MSQIKIPTRAQVDEYIKNTPSDEQLAAMSEAQDFMYDAMELYNRPSQAKKLVAAAFKKSPLCIDSYTFSQDFYIDELSECVTTLETALYIGEHLLKDELKNDKGFFWGLFETRPYMRAKEALANALWEKGELDQALTHYEDLLELNPNDNQGIRDILAIHYFEYDPSNKLENLLKINEDDCSLYIRYAHALFAFQHDLSDKEQIAKDAISSNPFVIELLAKRAPNQKKMAPYITMGSKEEAEAYLLEARNIWTQTPGAIDWIMGFKKDVCTEATDRL